MPLILNDLIREQLATEPSVAGFLVDGEWLTLMKPTLPEGSTLISGQQLKPYSKIGPTVWFDLASVHAFYL